MDKEQLKTVLIETFDTVSSGYDSNALRFFSKSAEHLTTCLKLQGDEHVLDVATGTGHAALSIASCLPEGQVTGVDFSSGMLDQARQKAAFQGLDNIDFVKCDMQNLEFPEGTFDIAVCSFGIFFVEDMNNQLAQIVRVVKPGGKIAITCFHESVFQPMIDLMNNRIANYGVIIPPQTWRHIAAEKGCNELFEKAGLENIQIEQKNVGYFLKNSEEWWEVLWNGGFRRMINQLSAEDQLRFKQEHLQEIEKLKTEKGIWLDVGVLFTIGTK